MKQHKIKLPVEWDVFRFFFAFALVGFFFVLDPPDFPRSRMWALTADGIMLIASGWLFVKGHNKISVRQNGQTSANPGKSS